MAQFPKVQHPCPCALASAPQPRFAGGMLPAHLFPAVGVGGAPRRGAGPKRAVLDADADPILHGVSHPSVVQNTSFPPCLVQKPALRVALALQLPTRHLPCAPCFIPWWRSLRSSNTGVLLLRGVSSRTVWRGHCWNSPLRRTTPAPSYQHIPPAAPAARSPPHRRAGGLRL